MRAYSIEKKKNRSYEDSTETQIFKAWAGKVFGAGNWSCSAKELKILLLEPLYLNLENCSFFGSVYISVFSRKLSPF